MRNEEFEIARDLMSRRGQQWQGAPFTARSIEPASFREIDGSELARQYVAHLKFRESERMALLKGTDEDTSDRILLGSAGGDRRSDVTVELAAYTAPERDSWLGSLARRLGWR